MKHTFSTTLDSEGLKLTWEIEKLHAKFSSYEPIYWNIPESFLEDWTWGEDHISDHISRCVSADFTYPILIWEGQVVDGCHRLCRAISDGFLQISAIEIDEMPQPDLEEEVSSSEEPPKYPKWTFGDMVKILQAIREMEYDHRHPLDGV
jgi:hypothetical protein